MNKSAFWVIGLSAATAACLPGDAAFKVKGSFIDERSVPYESCTFTVRYKGNVVDQTEVRGPFLETVVFHPSIGWSPLVIEGTCAGAQHRYTTNIERIPDDFSEPVDLGPMIVPREKPAT
jgi:hypothetical protein